MGTGKCILVCGVLVLSLISGYSAHSIASSRSAKILEEPNVQHTSSYEVISSSSTGSEVEDTSDRSLSVENNMLMFRSVLGISVRLIATFLIGKLMIHMMTKAGILKTSQGPIPGDDFNYLYAVDVNQNPAYTVQGGHPVVAGSTLLTTGGAAVHSTSTGAAAGASTGNAPLQLAPVPATSGVAYLTAGSNPRPNFLPPRPPRFRFGFGPRHPPPRRPLLLAPQHYNLGEETQYIDTHSHLYVMPDGSQARIPIGHAIQPVKPATVTLSTPENVVTPTASQQETKPAASTQTETATGSETATAQRRSSGSARESSQQPLTHQTFQDWDHFSPGA